MTRRVRLERDTLWLSAADMAALLVGIAVHVVLTRTFTDGDYGRWVLLLDLFYVTATIVDLGLPTLIGRDGERLGTAAQGLVHRCLKIQIRWALPIIAIGGILGWLWVGKSTIWLVASLILALSACVQILTYAHRAALRALGESRQEALVRFVDRGATAVGIVLAASLFGAHPIALALATFLGPIGAMIIAIWLGEKRFSIVTEDGFEIETKKAEGRALINLGLPFLLAAIALVANVRIEKLMLGILSTTDSVEIFQIAWLAFIAGYAPILSIRAVMLSWFGEVRDAPEKMWHRAKRAAMLIGVASIPGFFIGSLAGVEALVTVFPEYAEATTVFSWMLYAWILALFASVPLTLVQVSERPLRYAALLWLGIIADLLACWVLIPDSQNPAEQAAFAAIIGAAMVLTASTIEAWRLHSAASSVVTN